jgi:hypothetical protein
MTTTTRITAAHPAAGPAAQIPPVGTPEGMAGRVGHQVRGDETPQPGTHYGKHAPAPGISPPG